MSDDKPIVQQLSELIYDRTQLVEHDAEDLAADILALIDGALSITLNRSLG